MSTKQAIQSLMKNFTTEITPRSFSKINNIKEHLREGTPVYITFLPGSDFSETVAVARHLKKQGFVPIPHFSARSISNKKVLEENIKLVVNEAGVDQVLCVAGAVDNPVGDFRNSTQLLDTGLFDKYGIRKIAVAGHPEGNPNMSDKSIMLALKWKNDFKEKTDAEMHIVTQFVFEAKPIIEWEKILEISGNTLSIHIGIPGLATLKTLLMYAKDCGIGNSIKEISKQAKNIRKLMGIKTPDKLVYDLAHYQLINPNCSITGVHIYPLGGLKRSAKWSYAICDGKFKLNSESGFNVDVDIDQN